MHQEEFKKLLDELDGNSVKTLVEKNARYSSPDDCLHNFTAGAEILGGTPAQACWAYMTKHLTALRDKVDRDDFSDRDDLLEKCQDIINYIRFIWCLGNERRKDYVSEGHPSLEYGPRLTQPVFYPDGIKIIKDSTDEVVKRFLTPTHVYLDLNKFEIIQNFEDYSAVRFEYNSTIYRYEAIKGEE